MASYLDQWFNLEIFTGEIFSSFFIIIFFLFLKNMNLNKILKTLLISISIVISIFIGKSISNLMHTDSNYSFGFWLNILMSSFFFNKFSLIWSLLGAEVIGSILGALLFYTFYKINNIKIIHEIKQVSYIKNSFNQIFAQILLVIALFSISFMGHNSWMTATRSNDILKSVIILFSLFIIFIIFLEYTTVVISPLIDIIDFLFLKNKTKKDCIIILSNISIHLAITPVLIYGLVFFNGLVY